MTYNTINQPVVAGVKDFIVCMNETGIYLKLTFPNTILMQKTNDMGNILLQQSSGSTSINGLSLSNLITIYAPTAEHMKWIHDTVRGNLKSRFCIHKSFFWPTTQNETKIQVIAWMTKRKTFYL